MVLGNVLYRVAQILGRRGYDSTSFFYLGEDGRLHFQRDLVNVDKGEDPAKTIERLGVRNLPRTRLSGIHTRWGTSGNIDTVSQHPLYGCEKNRTDPLFLVAHNGILAGYETAREILRDRGHDFSGCLSDTGVFACLIEDYLGRNGGDLYSALLRSLEDFRGYGGDNPSTSAAVVVGKNPLQMIGFSLNEKPLLLATDVNGNRHFTSEEIALPEDITGGQANTLALRDGDIVQVTETGTEFTNLNTRVHHVPIQLAELGNRIKSIKVKEPDINLGQYPHHILKEVYQQPDAIEATIEHLDATRSNWISRLDEMEEEHPNDLYLGAGTSNCTGKYGELYSGMRGRNGRSEIASEILCEPPITQIPYKTIVYLITQSGETEDLRVAISELRRREDLRFVTVCNTRGAILMSPDYCDLSFLTQAGYERAVMATKTHTSQAAALGILNFRNDPKRLDIFRSLPEILRELIPYYDQITSHIVETEGPLTKVAFSSKGSSRLAVEESCIKFGEGCKLWTPGVPANEWKHHFITGVNQNSYIVFYVPNQPWARERTLYGIDQLTTRRGNIIVVGSNLDDIQKHERVKYRVEIPEVSELILPLTQVIFGQLLAYHNCLSLGLNPDNPPNLAKAATTE